MAKIIKMKNLLNETRIGVGIQTMKDNPPFVTPKQLKEVGAAPLYKKHVKSIDKQRDQIGRETLKFVDLLRKKGLRDAGDQLLDSYKENIVKFGKDLKQIVRKLV